PRKYPAAPPHSGSPSPGRVELLREIHRRVLQDRVRAAQLEILLPQPLQLLTLLARQQITPAAAVSLGLPHPVPQRLLMDAQVLGDMRDRTLRLEHETHSTLTQLIGVLPRSRHRRSISFHQDGAWHRSLQDSQGPSNSLSVQIR